MLKRLIALLIILIPSFSVFGQRSGHHLEVGAGYAPYFLVIVDDGIQMPHKCDAYLEWRYSMGEHLSVGAMIDYKTNPISSVDYVVTYSGTQHYGALLATAEYSLFPGKTINPFIGVGIGPAMIINHWKEMKTEPGHEIPDFPLGVRSPEYLFAAMPRIGFELFGHLRLSTSVDMSAADTRWPVCFNVGLTF